MPPPETPCGSAAFNGEARFLPRLEPTRHMGVVGQAWPVREQRGGDRAIACTAREYQPLIAGIGKHGRIEALQRHLQRTRDALNRELVRLAHVHEPDLSRIHAGLPLLAAEVFPCP